MTSIPPTTSEPSACWALLATTLKATTLLVEPSSTWTPSSPLPNLLAGPALPVTSVPMKLPIAWLLSLVLPWEISMPLPALSETTLPCPAPGPPTMLYDEPVLKWTPRDCWSKQRVVHVRMGWPVGPGPIRLPWTVLWSVCSLSNETPPDELPEITLRPAGVASPTVVKVAPWVTVTPSPPLTKAGATNVPAAFVPMKLPITLLSVALFVWIVIEWRRLYIARPRTTLFDELKIRPSTLAVLVVTWT